MRRRYPLKWYAGGWRLTPSLGDTNGRGRRSSIAGSNSVAAARVAAIPFAVAIAIAAAAAGLAVVQIVVSV